MYSFQYMKPPTSAACYLALDEYAGEADVLAGGTDLLIELKQGAKRPRYVIDIKEQPIGAPAITEQNGDILIGARTSMDTVATDLVDVLPGLSEAARIIGSPPIRRRATVGGNVAQASPSAEVVPALAVLDATLEIWSSTGARHVQVLDFAVGPRKSIRRPNELIHQIRVPRPTVGHGMAYLRFTPRRAIDIAIVNVGVSVALSPDGICDDCRIALGAVAPTVIRARRAESALVGERITKTLIRGVSELAASEARPIDDVRGSAAYRRELVKVLVRRAFDIASTRAYLEVPGGISDSRHH